jgi:ligand-binding sensor domain-containing protein
MKGRFILLFLIISLRSFAQSPHFRKHPLPLEFKNAGISCLIQDRNQFIWFGTTVGVVRFNGFSYKHFLPFPGSENNISALYEDRAGALWVGLKDGRVASVFNEKIRPASLADFPSAQITGFVELRPGEIWASTYGEGLFLVSGPEPFTINSTDGLNDVFVYGIAGGNDGVIYAGTDEGVSVCEIADGQKRVTSLETEAGIKDNIITALGTGPDGKLWIGSESQGIAWFDNSSRKFIYPSATWTYGRVTALLPVKETVWVGTAMHGLIEVDPHGNFVNPVSKDDATFPKRVTGLEQDSEGNIWVANGSGIVLSGNPLFSFLRNPTSGPGNIQAILYDQNGNIIYTTTTGVYSIKPHAATLKPEKLNIPMPSNAQVISLYEDFHGTIWLGTFDHGVYRYNPSSRTTTLFSESDGLVNNNVLSICGNKEQIWFATLGGVSQCTLFKETPGKVKFRNYTSENGLGSNYIYKIFIDSKDRIWFATDGEGVSVLDKGRFRNFSLNEGLKSNVIYSLTEDASGQIWVSTSNAGIYRFDGNAFQSFNPHNGLRDLAIASLIGEKNGNILIVSRQGVDVLDPKSGAVFYHGQEFGISDIDPNLNAYTLDRDGNVWMGTQRGIIKYNTNIPSLKKWPETRINEMQVFLTKADSADRTLSHQQNHVSFDYIGFWYHDPEEVSYKIKLQGYDREWTISKNNFITYPNLPPGDYTFMVQSSATNHFEGAPLKTYSFSIAPPFYNTPIFYAVATISVFAFAFWFIRNREKRVKARERTEKEKIEFQFETLKNQVNPHFLFNSFNTLAGVIEEDKDTAVEYVIKLSDFYRDILVNREKETIPLATELEMIGNYYFLQTKRYKDNFRLSIDVPADKLGLGIPPLTLQLLVENAIKHNIISRDKPLEVKIFIEDDYLVVKNNLQRKLIHEPSTGLGLSNIMNRFRLLTRKPVKVEETPAGFCVSIPLLNS